MKLSLLFAIILLIISAVSGHNPGLVAGIHGSFIDSLKTEYVNAALQQIRDIRLDDLEADNLKISGINFQILNEDLNNFIITLDEQQNGISITVKNTAIRGAMSWSFKKSILSLSGPASANGVIDDISLVLKFGNQAKGDFLIPSVSIKQMRISIDKDKWNFDINCKNCPGKIIDMAKKATKGMILKKMRSKIADFVHSRLAELINSKILASYPTSAKITDSLSMSTGHTGPIRVKSNYIQVPLDATIFITSEGYNRPFDSPIIKNKVDTNSGLVYAHFSDYMYDTLTASISKNPINFSSQLYGYNITFDINPSNTSMKLRNSDGKMNLSFSTKISIPDLYTSLDFESTIAFSLNFLPGDDSNVLFMQPQFDITSVEYTAPTISFFGVSIPIGPFSWLLSSMNEKLLLKYSNLAIRIPKVSGMSMTAAGGSAVFGDSSTSLVVS